MSLEKRGVITVVLLLFLSLFSVLATAETGCFTEPSYVTFHAGRSGCEFIDRAIADDICSEQGTKTAAETAECMNLYFESGKTCTSLAICQQKPGTWCDAFGDTCDSVNYAAECIDRTQWIGLNPDGTAPAKPARCVVGCCVCTAGICPTNVATGSVILKTQEECQSFCSDPDGLQSAVAKFLTGITTDQCRVECSAGLPTASATLEGVVYDFDTSQPLDGATVSAFSSTARTDKSGSFLLTNIPFGDVIVTASHPLYEPEHTLLSLSSATLKHKFFLHRGSLGAIRGSVWSTTKNPIPSAVISAGRFRVQTDTQGNFEIPAVPFGTYQVTAEHPDYTSATLSATITVQQFIATLPFVLTRLEQATLRITIIDDNRMTPLPFAEVQVDAIRYHTDSRGMVDIVVAANAQGVQKTVSVRHLDFDVVPSQTKTAKTGDIVPFEFRLIAIAHECVPPIAKPVENAQIQHVVGVKAVKLLWEKPCAEVSGYLITRRVKLVGSAASTFNPVAFVSALEYIDTTVAWNTAYDYEIAAVYYNGGLRQSSKVLLSITTGVAECEGQLGKEFCSADGKKRQQCNVQNQVIPATSPGERDCSRNGNAFCSTTKDGLTFCRNANSCSRQQFEGTFGLWFTPLFCYGSPIAGVGLFQNYCTFDQAQSGTIFEECISCDKFTSCLDYQTKDACQINNCRASGAFNCTWSEFSSELNKGQCVPQNYTGNDLCGECSKQNTIFQSTSCTPARCVQYGACYARADETECIACVDGQSSCSDFNSEIECIDHGQNPSFSGGVYRESTDTCGLGRCYWDALSQACFKDGNADRKDDCEQFGAGSSCGQDVVPAHTTIERHLVRVGDYADTITFLSQDNAARIYFCIDRTNNCIPQLSENFVDNVTLRKAVVDFDIMGLKNVYIAGTRDYYLRFYSEDTFFNAEDVQTLPFAADIEPPVITLQKKIQLNKQGSTLTFNIFTDEQSNCTDGLYDVRQQKIGSRVVQSIGTVFEAIYPVNDGVYDYKVSCRDDFGNDAEKRELAILVDADDSINITSPQRAVRSEKVVFKIVTSDPSDCTLENNLTGQHWTLARNSTGKTHVSNEFVFVPNTIYTTFWVECREFAQFGGETHRRPIVFTIDRQPPQTSVKITSKDGFVQVKDKTGWTAHIASEASVTFVCNDLPEISGESVGFGCAQTIYCLNETSASCIPSQTTVPVSVSRKTYLCYFSFDKNGTQELRNCGTILVDNNFGLDYIQPPFGMSATPIFDLELSSQVPVKECKWVNSVPVPPAYHSIVAARNIFTTINAHDVKITDFHNNINFQDGVAREIIVMCNATTDVVSPPQRMFVGFDTTIPLVQHHEAKPSMVIEGNSVEFIVETNEPTICKYGKGIQFSGLTGKFPGFDDKFFVLKHQASVPLTAADDNKAHEFNISCMNRAVLWSNISLAPIRFTVNFSIAGSIISLSPQTPTKNTTVTLEVTTSKNAACEFAQNGTFVYFSQTSGTEHKERKDNLAEKVYSFPVRCTFVSPATTRDGLISFIVDRKVPIVSSVDDGVVSCSLKKVGFSVVAYDNETSIVEYRYEVYKKGTTTLLQSGIVNSNKPKIDELNLTDGGDYFFKVLAVDAAGNIGLAVSSDGYVAHESDNIACKDNRAPQLSLNQTTVRDGVSVAVVCRDDSGCTNQRYGLGSKTSCSAANAYVTPVVVTTDTTFCAYAEDTTGKNVTIRQDIVVQDKDKDNVPDKFDKCNDTPAGQTVDADGCSIAQRFIDTDKDLLGDTWELQYNEADCALDPRQRDSDANGIDDGEEDYDNDGSVNGEEQLARTHPCLKTQPPVTQPPFQPPSDIKPDEESDSSVVAVILLLFGVFLMITGGGYLYYIRVLASPRRFVQPQRTFAAPTMSSPIKSSRSLAPVQQETPHIQELRTAIKQERREKRLKELERKRKMFDVFGQFGGK
ncbi:carboxypeptidase regulatory-like domain-containing protein [Candidatus Woesearchaeota archaeon]|nr:carboxypeptidase regulatory-like domain-containing protein [Candidatus Woesearchaeota archaeon]